jgi:diadenosine tetraphosphate (Ap4A) HIT family hydrolase
MPCELCDAPGGELVWESAHWRVVLVDDADYPGFCRVIWNAHVREMTDLSAGQRAALMAAVFVVEQAAREVLAPDKINLASLGNQTPHLHWHVIPRWAADRHFPAPIWSPALRSSGTKPAQGWRDRLKSVLVSRLRATA